MLRTRFLTALVALPIMLAVALIGGWLFAGVVFVALLIGGWEYVALWHKGGYAPPLWLVLALIALPVGAVWFDHADWRAPGLALILIADMLYAIRHMEAGDARPVLDLALAVFGGVYIGWLGSTLLATRLLTDGAYFVILVYSLVAITDSAAYFVGRQFGTHKMSPRVSPKKSWEGYTASVVSGPIVGALVGGLAGIHALTWGHGAMIGLLVGVLGTVGDLGISAIKRQVGAKDSSHLIPGHGGILDRIDSVLVATAVSYYYLIWFVT